MSAYTRGDKCPLQMSAYTGGDIMLLKVASSLYKETEELNP